MSFRGKIKKLHKRKTNLWFFRKTLKGVTYGPLLEAKQALFQRCKVKATLAPNFMGFRALSVRNILYFKLLRFYLNASFRYRKRVLIQAKKLYLLKKTLAARGTSLNGRVSLRRFFYKKTMSKFFFVRLSKYLLRRNKTLSLGVLNRGLYLTLVQRTFSLLWLRFCYNQKYSKILRRQVLSYYRNFNNNRLKSTLNLRFSISNFAYSPRRRSAPSFLRKSKKFKTKFLSVSKVSTAIRLKNRLVMKNWKMLKERLLSRYRFFSKSNTQNRLNRASRTLKQYSRVSWFKRDLFRRVKRVNVLRFLKKMNYKPSAYSICGFRFRTQGSFFPVKSVKRLITNMNYTSYGVGLQEKKNLFTFTLKNWKKIHVVKKRKSRKAVNFPVVVPCRRRLILPKKTKLFTILSAKFLSIRGFGVFYWRTFTQRKRNSLRRFRVASISRRKKKRVKFSYYSYNYLKKRLVGRFYTTPFMSWQLRPFWRLRRLNYLHKGLDVMLRRFYFYNWTIKESWAFWKVNQAARFDKILAYRQALVLRIENLLVLAKFAPNLRTASLWVRRGLVFVNAIQPKPAYSVQSLEVFSLSPEIVYNVIQWSLFVRNLTKSRFWVLRRKWSRKADFFSLNSWKKKRGVVGARQPWVVRQKSDQKHPVHLFRRATFRQFTWWRRINPWIWNLSYLRIPAFLELSPSLFFGVVQRWPFTYEITPYTKFSDRLMRWYVRKFITRTFLRPKKRELWEQFPKK